MGEKLPENVVYAGNVENLKGVRFVITVDVDTQLPKNTARELVEVISHPLNRPYLNDDQRSLKRGYTIIQPRVCTDFSHTKISWFLRIFADPSALDPYTQAVSNIYQDLTGEGNYHGKGIYDVNAFYHILNRRFPEEHLLSHDLLEGSYVRTSFASDIVLFDLYPESYLAWARRQHRWLRGDWQIVDWIFPKVPVQDGNRERNPISVINRWKIFDNLRRSLLPVTLMLLLVCGWFSPSAELWTGLATLVIFLPFILLGINKLIYFSSSSPPLEMLNEFNTVLLRTFVSIAMLPYEAYLSIDALCRVFYRRFISHRRLLQWNTSTQESNHSQKKHRNFLMKVSFVSLFALIAFFDVKAALFALPFCFLWFIAPVIVSVIDRPLLRRPDVGISVEDRKFLRQIARRTWRYFDDFVNPHFHWLPPDNFQTSLKVEAAPRTSPTNIGLWLMSAMGAYDLKFIGCDELIDRTILTMNSLKKLERYEGHFLNWYDIVTLLPLYPRYISTVDSGNFIACLWTLKHGFDQGVLCSPILTDEILLGMVDTFEIFKQTTHIKDEVLSPILNFKTDNISTLMDRFEELRNVIEKHFHEAKRENAHGFYWLKKIEEQLNHWNALVDRYFLWVKILKSISLENLNKIDPHASEWMEQAFLWKPSLKELAKGEVPLFLSQLIEGSQKEDLSKEIKAWGIQLKEALSKAAWFAGEKMGQVNEVIKDMEQITTELNLNYLYNTDRKLFAIGYNVDDRRLDSSYYDLLASEARISSLIAIAKENIPIDHWWSLGRPYSVLDGRRVLLSWGGTMFEYLMPMLFNKYFEDSLLGQACKAVVITQMNYGKKLGIPWGISESAFSAIDAYKTYQYQSFGIPGLGLKRGLEKDLVVSPYSTGLALMIDAPNAIRNFRRLKDKYHLLGSHGFFESIDFTRERSRTGERGVIVHTYMVHHQGMIMGSINNLLNNDIFKHRFHSEPKIAGVESLLYERIPYSPPIKVRAVKKEHPRLQPFPSIPVMGMFETPMTITPKVNLLSNGNYSIMVTNAGGGYKLWQDIEITRWRSDTTQDSWGSFCYIKDQETGEIWSNTFHPTLKTGKHYTAKFQSDKAEFRRRDHDIETITDVVVCSEDNVDIRLITLINHSKKTRYLELTSYEELSLAPHNTDRAHPCFNKLFIETEYLPEQQGLLAFRRKRSDDEKPFWVFHTVAMEKENQDFQFETDRSRFIGRGKTLANPQSLENKLSNTAGTVLDPIFSVRKQIVLEPGGRLQIAFITGVTDNRNAVETLIAKYRELSSSNRAIELAWTYAQLEMRHLRVHQEEVQLFQMLASRILYPHSQLRPSESRLKSNRLGQSHLWGYGISGDLPIVVVSVGDVYDVDLVIGSGETSCCLNEPLAATRTTRATA